MLTHETNLFTLVWICANSLFPFSHDQVRIVLFRECDWTGRRLLFDSSAIQKVNVPPASNLIISTSSVNRKNSVNNNNNNTEKPTDGKSTSRHFIEVSNGYGYIYDATPIDSNSIGEMIFGSIAMSFRGTSFKVFHSHRLHTSTQYTKCSPFIRRFIGCPNRNG